MKTYKELQEDIQVIMETEETIGGAAQSAHSHSGLHYIEQDENVGRLNAFLNAFTDREFLDPKTAVAQIRNKFNQAGLDFQWNNNSKLTNETVKIPLLRWGGSFGTIPTHDLMKDGFYKSDNIKEFNNGQGLALKITAEQPDHGLYTIDAKIVPSGENGVSSLGKVDDQSEVPYPSAGKVVDYSKGEPSLDTQG